MSREWNIPHVIMDNRKDGYELEIRYKEELANTDSRSPEELRKSLHARKIPEAYKKVISDIEVKKVRQKAKEDLGETEETGSIYGTPEKMLNRVKEGYFVRVPERNVVYCPAGEITRKETHQKTERTAGRYGTLCSANKRTAW